MRHEDPRENILNAATKVFAEHGFRDATVRQICAAARTNVSMVNYYFSSKEKLYAEVVNRLFLFVTTDDMMRFCEGITDQASWQAAVRRFVETFVGYVSVTSEPGIYAAQIFRWEVTRPSTISRELQFAYGNKVYEVLKTLLTMALGDDSDAVKIWGGAIWSRIAALVVIDKSWVSHFVPRGIDRAEWLKRVADNICEAVFGSLRYRG